MKKVVAFGASSSRSSINQKLAIWAASQLEHVEVLALDLNDFEMPIYSVDKEQENGIPQEALNFKAKINEADALIISFAEHNGSYSAAFKNIYDWVSRIEGDTWNNSPTLLLSSSPGPKGGQNVLASATSAFPYQGAQVTGSFSLPSFGQNFESKHGISNPALQDLFNEQLKQFKDVIHAA